MRRLGFSVETNTEELKEGVQEAEASSQATSLDHSRGSDPPCKVWLLRISCNKRKNDEVTSWLDTNRIC